MSIAPATPTILPIPTVALKDVVNAWKDEMSPLIDCESDSMRLKLNVRPILKKRYLSCKKVKRIVRKRPVPTRKNTKTGPET